MYSLVPKYLQLIPFLWILAINLFSSSGICCWILIAYRNPAVLLLLSLLLLLLPLLLLLLVLVSSNTTEL